MSTNPNLTLSVSKPELYANALPDNTQAITNAVPKQYEITP
jgi:hypothetical protein